MIRFILNHTEISTQLPPGTLVLDFVRYHRNLTGTKIGCREGDCGACTVLVGEIRDEQLVYRSMTSCLLAIENVDGKHVVTVEGVNMENLNPVQQCMNDEGASQCGFCTPGFVVSLCGFCLSREEHTYEGAIASMDGNICRCTGYKSIERAAAKLTGILRGKEKGGDWIGLVADHKILPEYFKGIESRLKAYHNSNHDPEASGSAKKILGGGTDLYVQQPEIMSHSPLYSLFDRSEMKGISRQGDTCTIGASATVTDLWESDVFRSHFPGMSRYIKLVSSTPIRNMATIAGNFINASPIGDFTIFFLALNAQLDISDGTNQRKLPLRKLYKGYKDLAKLPGEYIRCIEFLLPGENTRFNFEKVSKRTHLDIASVNTAISLEMDGDRIAEASLSAGGVGPVPLFLSETSAFLRDKLLSVELVTDAIEVAKGEISPMSDTRGTKEYKTLLLSQLIKAHFATLFPAMDIEKLLKRAS